MKNKQMTFINLEQGTQEWKNKRAEYIGGSDIPVIVIGEHYKKNRIRFYKEKAEDRLLAREGKDVKSRVRVNPAMLRGHKIEAKQRPLFELLQDKDFPPKIGVSKKITFAMASFDGLSEDNVIWECKYTRADEVTKALAAPYSYLPPTHFYLQIQFQMLVSGADKAFLTMCSADVKGNILDTYNKPLLRDKECIKKITLWLHYSENEINKHIKKLENEIKTKSD